MMKTLRLFVYFILAVLCWMGLFYGAAQLDSPPPQCWP